MPPIGAILFDLDDTLLDASAAWRTGMERLIRTRAPGQAEIGRGLDAWAVVFARWFDPYLRGSISLEASRAGRIRDWADQLDLVVPAGAELDWFDSYTVGYRSGWARFSDVDPMLSGLPHLPTGLITNGHGTQQRDKVAALALLDVFDVIVVSSEFGAPKPDPTIFRAAADQLGVDPRACLMIGDQLDTDVSGALAAGMRAVWLRRPSPAALATTAPTAPTGIVGRYSTVTTLAEVPALVESC